MLVTLKNVTISRHSVLIQLINDKGLKALVNDIATLSMRSAEQEEEFMKYNTSGSPLRSASHRLTDVAKYLPQEGLWGLSNDGHKR